MRSAWILLICPLALIGTLRARDRSSVLIFSAVTRSLTFFPAKR